MPTPNLDIGPELKSAVDALRPAVKRLKNSLLKLNLEKTTPGALADVLYSLRDTKKQLAALAAPLEDLLDPKMKEIEKHFVNTLAVGESTGVQGYAARVQITESVVPTVDDWEKFYAHIKKTGNFELLNRAPNRKAISERWDAKKQVPGVGKFVSKKVSCTKLSGKDGG